VERYTLSSIAGLELPAAVARPRFNIARGQDAAVAVLRGGARELAALAPFTGEVPIVADGAWLDDEDHDDPRCIAPLGNPAQGELF
jgi:hypothetical protein